MTTSSDDSSKKRASPRPFPQHSLEEALKVARVIQDKNAGKPWKPIFIAEALGISPTSTKFRDITSSAYRYGLTDGTWNAQQISLTTLGVSIVKPIDPTKEIKAKQQSVLNVPLFKEVYEHYTSGKFPSADDKYFKNMLEQQFKVPHDYIDECVQILLENGKFASIIRDIKGSPFVVFAETPPETPPEAPKGEEIPPTPPEIPITPTPPSVNQIFIAHGKNTIPLEQVKKILTEFKIPFKVAVDEPNIGRPIPKKVAELMKSCTSAIVILTTDEEYTDKDGNKFYRPSDNAVYELGAASILYDNRIVILKEKGVCLASDFSDLGYIEFEKDELEAKTMNIMKEFIGLGILKVTPA